MVEDPRAEDAVVAGQRAGDVLGGLPHVEADLGALDVDGVPAQVDHGHLGGVAGPGRRLLEEERHALAGQRAGAPAPRARARAAAPRRRGRGRRCRRGWAWLRSSPASVGPRAGDRLGQGLAEDPHGGVDLVVAHEQGRRHADGVGPHRVDQQAPFERPGRGLLRRPGHRQLRRQQQAGAAHRDDARQTAQPGGQARARRAGPAADVLGLHHGERRPHGGQGQRLAAEGRAVVARAEGRRHFGPGPAGPDRHAVAERLGHRHHVGLEPLGLEGEPVAGAARARSAPRRA